MTVQPTKGLEVDKVSYLLKPVTRATVAKEDGRMESKLILCAF